jgi:hypothetical protein
MDKITEQILQKRMHGLYLTRKCSDLTQLSHALLGLHCWFHRNVAFSSLIRGADIENWKTELTKTWLYRGTLHGVAFEDLPTLLALHPGQWRWGEQFKEIADRAVDLMEDGVHSRAEMRRIFAYDYDPETIERAFSPWGGVFCELARLGKVAFRNMTSRDFDLISAEPTMKSAEVLSVLFRRFISAYGPATLADAAWFFGLFKERKNELSALDLTEYSHLEYGGSVYYYLENNESMDNIPKLTLLSGFDPLIVSYTERSAILPPEYKKAVILSSGICLPTVAVDGQIAGLWNIKKGTPTVEFFLPQPKRIKDATFDLVGNICQQTKHQI